jgi:hypothetical protein
MADTPGTCEEEPNPDARVSYDGLGLEMCAFRRSKIMSAFIDGFHRLFPLISEQSMQNGVATAVCVVLYGIFIHERGKRLQLGRRSMRSADSVLRDVAIR